MFNVIDFINRKKAEMSILCNLISKNLEGKAKQNAKWTDRTTHARQGITGESNGINGQHSISLSYGVDYGKILEEGQKPHDITPKNGKALYWKGASHPVKRVHHPGTEGFHTLENTLRNSKEEVISLVKEYWED